MLAGRFQSLCDKNHLQVLQHWTFFDLGCINIHIYFGPEILSKNKTKTPVLKPFQFIVWCIIFQNHKDKIKVGMLSWFWILDFDPPSTYAERVLLDHWSTTILFFNKMVLHCRERVYALLHEDQVWASYAQIIFVSWFYIQDKNIFICIGNWFDQAHVIIDQGSMAIHIILVMGIGHQHRI